jgi:hypothetical protein
MNTHAPKILSRLAPFHIVRSRSLMHRPVSLELVVTGRPKHSRDRRVLRLSKLAAIEPFLLRIAGAVDLAPRDEGALLTGWRATSRARRRLNAFQSGGVPGENRPLLQRPVQVSDGIEPLRDRRLFTFGPHTFKRRMILGPTNQVIGRPILTSLGERPSDLKRSLHSPCGYLVRC